PRASRLVPYTTLFRSLNQPGFRILQRRFREGAGKQRFERRGNLSGARRQSPSWLVSGGRTLDNRACALGQRRQDGRELLGRQLAVAVDVESLDERSGELLDRARRLERVDRHAYGLLPATLSPPERSSARSMPVSWRGRNAPNFLPLPAIGPREGDAGPSVRADSRVTADAPLDERVADRLARIRPRGRGQPRARPSHGSRSACWCRGGRPCARRPAAWPRSPV